MPIYRTHEGKDQQFIIDALKGDLSRIIMITPQWLFNSYPDGVYGKCTDFRNNRGCWQPGDFMVHCPGRSLQEKLNILKDFEKRVIHA